MSNGNYGMQTAAQSYYGKGSQRSNVFLNWLSLLVCLRLQTSMIHTFHPEAAQERRNLVLSEMKGKVTFQLSNMKKRLILRLQMDFKVQNQLMVISIHGQLSQR